MLPLLNWSAAPVGEGVKRVDSRSVKAVSNSIALYYASALDWSGMSNDGRVDPARGVT